MGGRLAGKRILIVEDEYFIASDLKRALCAAGAIPVGPVNRVAEGMALLDDALDGAVLDVNLENERSYPLADALAKRLVPFMFVTGYDTWALPDAYQDVPRVAKPFRPVTIIERIEQLLHDKMAVAT